MKLKLERLFYWAIIFQILATQGVLFFNIFKYFGNWELKKITHPLSFLFVLSVFIIKSVKKMTVTILDVLFLGYLTIFFIIMLFNVDGIESGYVVFREVNFIFVLIFIFSQIEISKRNWNKILNVLFVLLILNSIFILLTNYLGPEKYMKMITGRYKWGVDPEYKFKISNFYRFWRSPALIGNAASVAYFSVISYLLMDQNEKFKRKKYLALFPLIFSFVRSAYLIFLVYEFLKFFTKKKNLKILVLIFKIGTPILIILGIVLSKYDILSTASLLERFYLWGNKTSVEYNLFFGGAIGTIGGGARGEGFLATIDSYWLYLLFSVGLIGIIFMLLFVYEKSKKTNKFYFILISFSLAGFLVSFNQSLVFLALFPLFFLKIKDIDVLNLDNEP